MTEVFDAVIVGAGPAGSAAATVLAREGRRVLVLEKDRFPRPKVCGEFLSSDASSSLDLLGVREELERYRPERIERGFLYPLRGPAVSFRLPAPAFGISRFILDDLLARRAGKEGADIRFGARAFSVQASPEACRIRFLDGQRNGEASARIVIGAWGRWDALDRALKRGFLRGSGRYFGWSRDYRGDTAAIAGQVRLYVFQGGYCGLSRVEGGAVNLAGIVSENRLRRLGGWEGVCEYARLSNPALDSDLSLLETGPIGFLGTGPVFFRRKPIVENGILMAGDAAGVLDPFSGEGQAAALASGILAGETSERALRGEILFENLPVAYARAWRRRFARRFQWSSLLRLLVLHPNFGALAGRLAGESLVRFAIAATRR